MTVGRFDRREPPALFRLDRKRDAARLALSPCHGLISRRTVTTADYEFHCPSLSRPPSSQLVRSRSCCRYDGVLTLSYSSAARHVRGPVREQDHGLRGSRLLDPFRRPHRRRRRRPLAGPNHRCSDEGEVAGGDLRRPDQIERRPNAIAHAKIVDMRRGPLRRRHRRTHGGAGRGRQAGRARRGPEQYRRAGEA